MRRFVASCVVAPALLIAASCGGSSGSGDLFGNGTAIPDGAAPTNDSGRPPLPFTDSGGADTGAADSGLVVEEKDAPECHDLELRGDPVAATANPSPPPAQTSPLTSIAPGLYGVKSIIDYGGAVAQADPSRTTVFFTATKQYYISDDGSGAPPNRLTLTWKLGNGKLSRTIVCGRSSAGNVVEYRADASANGFTVYVPLQGGPGNRISAYRYEKLD